MQNLLGATGYILVPGSRLTVTYAGYLFRLKGPPNVLWSDFRGSARNFTIGQA